MILVRGIFLTREIKKMQGKYENCKDLRTCYTKCIVGKKGVNCENTHQTSFLRCFEIVFRFHFSHYLKMYICSKIKPCAYHFRVTQPWRRKRTKQNGRPDSLRRIKRLKGGNCELHILYDLSSTLKWNISIKMRVYTHFFLIDKD